MTGSCEKEEICCVGIPLKQEHDETHISSSPTPALSKPSPASIDDNPYFEALTSFSIGFMLGFFGWVANNGWAILSFCLLEPLAWTTTSILKHLALAITGSLCSSCAIFTTLESIFGSIEVKERLEQDNPNEADISYQLERICEVGLAAGYLGSQTQLTNLLYKPFHIELNPLPGWYYPVVVCFLFLWMIRTKVEDYMRAVKRADKASKVDDAECSVYAQIV